MLKYLVLLLHYSLMSQLLHAESIKIACASSFVPVLKKVISKQPDVLGQKIKIIPGSTGKIYSQIKYGAPFDIFLAADRKHPDLLLKEGRATSSFIYARGQLAFWLGSRFKSQGTWHEKISSHLKSKTIAIANPEHAPFGIAAKQVLDEKFSGMAKKILRGANAAQTFLYISQRHDLAGFVSLSHLVSRSVAESEYILIPQQNYDPIVMAGVILGSSSQQEASKKFMTYLLKSEVQDMISQHGFLRGDGR